MVARADLSGLPSGSDRANADTAVVAILYALSFSHLVNDTFQSILPSIYPLLRQQFALDFGQIGLIQLAFQMTAAVLQPAVGFMTDKRSSPYSLAVAMTFSLVGVVLLARAPAFPMLVAAAAVIGIGSSIFHPEASRIARAASGGRYGFAQSLFQVGGYGGAALGPLVAAFLVVPNGQHAIGWLGVLAFAGLLVLGVVGRWYAGQLSLNRAKAREAGSAPTLPRAKVATTIAILLALIFSKFVYIASISSFFTFYLMHKFGIGVQAADLFLFAFLMVTAVGTFFGGPIGDRFGRRTVIWGSILGVLPLTLAMPHLDLPLTGLDAVLIGLILSSAFPAIVVLGQELVPGRIGAVTGLFFGSAFGMAGLGAAALGALADRMSITTVYELTAFLPAIGLIAYFLPRIERRAAP